MFVNRDPLIRVFQPTKYLDACLRRLLYDQDQGEANGGHQPELKIVQECVSKMGTENSAVRDLPLR